MSQPWIVSIQVGLPQQRSETRLEDGETQTWTSGIFKQPVAGRIWVGKLQVAGDGQADRKHHGGPDRPVLAYAAEAYDAWHRELPGTDLPYGAFGENWTVSGMNEDTVCIGDTYRVGDVVVQVSQPRVPCWKLGRRHGLAELPAKVAASGRTGWYLRVLVEGEVEAGATVELTERPYPEWTVTRAHAAMKHRRSRLEEAAALANCPFVSADWKQMLSR